MQPFPWASDSEDDDVASVATWTTESVAWEDAEEFRCVGST
jgi:hypothetical protein